MIFWIAWSMDALVALVVFFIFFSGLGNGTVSSFNMGIWLGLLLVVSSILGGSWWLKTIGHMGWASAVALLLAVPALLYVLFFLFLIISNPRWN